MLNCNVCVKQVLSIKWLLPFSVLILLSYNAEAFMSNSIDSISPDTSIIGFDLMDSSPKGYVMEESSIIKENVMLNLNQTTIGFFTITLFDFHNEAVRVAIYDIDTENLLYAINLEPDSKLYTTALLTVPLESGKYHIVIEGDSRIIPKTLNID